MPRYPRRRRLLVRRAVLLRTLFVSVEIFHGGCTDMRCDVLPQGSISWPFKAILDGFGQTSPDFVPELYQQLCNPGGKIRHVEKQ